jgi:glycerol kinase
LRVASELDSGSSRELKSPDPVLAMSLTSAILALDQGTTGTTALVISSDGRILGRGYSEFTQYFPKPGWVEHDADEIRDVTIRVAREALEAARNRERHRVHGIGITNQRETIVLWDRETGRPVHRAIVWQDRRTAGICRELKEAGHEAEVRRRTGLVLDPYFSATKLTWIFRENPELERRARDGELACGTIDSWLIHCLTGGRGPPHRPHERLPDPPVRPGVGHLEPRDEFPFRRARRHPSGDPLQFG